jgi:hypothetical protein
MGMLSAVLFFVLSNAKPLERLSPERPHPHIFCLYVFSSLVLQFGVHLAFLVTMYSGAYTMMPKARAGARPGPRYPIGYSWSYLARAPGPAIQ